MRLEKETMSTIKNQPELFRTLAISANIASQCMYLIERTDVTKSKDESGKGSFFSVSRSNARLSRCAFRNRACSTIRSDTSTPTPFAIRLEISDKNDPLPHPRSSRVLDAGPTIRLESQRHSHFRTVKSENTSAY